MLMKFPVIKVHQLQTIKHGNRVYLRGEEAAKYVFPTSNQPAGTFLSSRSANILDGGRMAWLPDHWEVTLGPDRRPHTLTIKVSLESQKPPPTPDGNLRPARRHRAWEWM